MPRTPGPSLAAKLTRIAGIILLSLAALLYLQFGLSAIRQSPMQAALVFLGLAAIVAGIARLVQIRPASARILVGTLPLLVMQVIATLLVEDESPAFIVISGIVPISAGTTWLVGRHSARRAGLRTDPC
jgi:hypothetical protein